LAKKNLAPLIIAVVLCFPVLSFPASPTRLDEARKLMTEAGDLVRKGKLDESLVILKKAVNIAPKEPDMHMNYGTILFIKGQKFFQLGFEENAKRVFKEAQDELVTAIKLYKAAPAKDPKDFAKAQCYFLLGDIYYYIYKNEERAKGLYRRAVEYDPKHAGALEALKRLKVYER